MIEDRELSSLLEYVGPHSVLSVYLDTDLSQRTKDGVRLLFLDRADEYSRVAAAEIKAVQRFLELEFDWKTRGLAIFSSHHDLWKVIPLPIAVSTQVYYSKRPYVRALTDVMDRFGPYAIALVDKESLRLFSAAWGKIVPETESFGEELKRHRQEGYYASGYQRHEDTLALRNLKQAAEVLQDYCQRSDCRRFMLAGATEAVAQVKELLPKALQERLIGEFAADVDESPGEVLARSLEVLEQVDREREQALVQQVLTATAKGGLGVIGVTDTLYALHQGRVHLLLADAELHSSGYVCEHCGYTLTEMAVECPMCKYHQISETPDVINRAIQKAMDTGAEVNIVRQNEQLNQAGGIAALLRY